MKQKIAIVTGGASGIGLATCKLLVKKDYKVVISDINEGAGVVAVNDLNTTSDQTVFFKADVTKFDEVKALVDFAVKHFGRLDLMVNNAGIGPKEYERVADHSLDVWDKVIAVNQSGVFYGMKAALSQMEQQGSGNIVNISSLAGIKGSTTGMAYSASKFAVVGMTKSAALEYSKRNIRINAVCPSFTETPLFNDSNLGIQAVKEKLLKTVPIRRFADPDEIAQGILWLASDDSSYITGHILVIDGGTSI